VTTASSTELRCLFENWSHLLDNVAPTCSDALDCIVIASGTAPLVTKGLATPIEAGAVRIAHADTDLAMLRFLGIRPRDLDVVRDAVALLNQALPRTCANTVGLAPRLVKIDNVVPSMHLSGSPGFIYISERVFGGSTWVLADALLHETLHEKSNLLRKFRGLLRSSYREATSATTLLPWSVDYGEERHFSTWRLLSAGHVYVHLYALRCTLGLWYEARTPHDRARFMLDALEQPAHLEDLDSDGRLMLEWLNSAIRTTPRETAS
jgi:hypothetical protein